MNKISLYTTTVLLMLSISVPAQLTVEACQEKARINYPLVRQFGLIEQTRDFNLENAAKGYLPQISFSAKATYQSEVTKVPVSLPNLKIETLSKDQYQALAEVSQTIWDGGVIRSQNQLTNASAEVDRQSLEVDLFTLKDRVNQLFFGILLIDEQLKQNDLLQKELQINLERVTAYVKNGVANQADLDAIQVEQLKTGQLRTGLIAAGKTYREMLSALIKENISEMTQLVRPEVSVSVDTLVNNRPELWLFDARQKMLESQKSALYAANRPKIGAFLQGGIGKPGLNMLKNEFSPFYIGGIRILWSLGGFYTLKNNLSKIEINHRLVDTQKETFLFNNGLASKQQYNEISKIRELIGKDDEIIRLRTNIKHSAEAKVANGTLTVSDLIREIDAENMAMQDKALHEIELLLSEYNLKNTRNH